MASRRLHIMLVAGEPSGEVLGARLMSALRDEWDGDIKFDGIGGENMARQGLQSLFPMEELSVMGFAEVLPRLPQLLRRIDETVQTVKRLKPDVLVTIDSPGFNERVARRLKGAGIPLVHYVAPQVWAWRPGRAKKIARTFDHLLALLPFEPPYFEREGMTCDFVGHSVVEDVLSEGEKQSRRNAFRTSREMPDGSRILAILPGSRNSEIGRMLPVFKETVERLKDKVSNLYVVVPTLPHLEQRVREMLRGLTVPVAVIVDKDEKISAFAAADGALAASGTVSLELAAAGVPTLIAYKANPISIWIGRRVIRVPWITLSNIILDRALVGEKIQDQCRPDILSEELFDVLTNDKTRADQLEGYDEVLQKLGAGGEVAPSVRAARSVISALRNRQ